MARTTINSLGIPADTIVSADLDYPLTDFSSTGIDDNASSTSLTIDSSGNITVTGTVDGRDLATDGTKLDGIAASATNYGDSDVATYISGNRSYGNITTTGYIAGPSTFTIDPAAVGDNTGTLVIAGNLQVDGTTTTINSTTMTVDDLNITLASGAANAAAANGAGITVDGASATLTYNGTNDDWNFNKTLNVTGNLKVDSNAANVTLTLENSTNANGYIQYAADGTMRFYTGPAGGSTGIRTVIDNAGNVGINTTSSPLARLHVKGENGNQLSLDNDASQFTQANWYNNGAQKAAIWYDNSKAEFASYSTTELTFYTGANSATAKVTIDSNGNLGIGITNPATNLHILDSNPVVRLQSSGAGTDNSLSFLSRNISNVGAYADIIGEGAGHNSTNAPIVFTQGSTQTERMRIDSSGNVVISSGSVGIGTNVPRSKLDLGADSSGGTQISWHSSSTRSLGNIWTSNNGGRLTFGQALKGSTTTNNGYLGAYTGTWAPSAMELSYGVINLYADAAQSLTYGGAFTPTLVAKFHHNTGFTAEKQITIDNSASATLVLDADHTTFSGRQAAFPGRFVIGPPGNGYPDIGYNFRNTAGASQTYIAADTAWKISVGAGNEINFYDAAVGTVGNTISWRAPIMTLQGAGENQVGINEGTPAARLHVNGDQDWTMILQNSGTGGSSWYIGSTNNAYSSGGGRYVITNTGTSATSQFCIDSEGHVLLGTNNDVYGTTTRKELQVYGSGEAILTLDTAGASPVYINNNAGLMDIYNINNNDIRFGNNNSEKMRLLTSGGVYHKEQGNNGDYTSYIGSTSNSSTGNKYLHVQISTTGNSMFWIEVVGYDYTATSIYGRAGGYIYLYATSSTVYQDIVSGSIVQIWQNTSGYLEVVVDTGSTATGNRWGSCVFRGGTDTIRISDPLEIIQYSWTATTAKVY